MAVTGWAIRDAVLSRNFYDSGCTKDVTSKETRLHLIRSHRTSVPLTYSDIITVWHLTVPSTMTMENRPACWWKRNLIKTTKLEAGRPHLVLVEEVVSRTSVVIPSPGHARMSLSFVKRQHAPHQLFHSRGSISHSQLGKGPNHVTCGALPRRLPAYQR
jgi:hypothetical protein